MATAETLASEAQTRRYRAFVSYSHRDKAPGAKLFRKLDGYRTPKALVGAETRFGPAPAKLYPLFRDREELTTAPDLSDRIKAALAGSEHLVVLCSPDAAQSPWVNREITEFAALHGPERIHPVIARGAPPDCFPPALLAVQPEPIAADLRPEGDGWTDGPLKAIAGILGVGFGALRDREVDRARRRTRFALGLASLFLALFVGAAAATYVALDRSERLQNALIAILDQVTDRVSTVLADQETGAGNLTVADAQREIDFAKGLVDTAFALAPENPRLMREQGRLLLAFSRHYRQIGEISAALDAAVDMKLIATRLEELGGNDADSMARMYAFALVEHGDALRESGDHAGALTAYEQSLTIIRRLASVLPRNADWVRDLSVVLDRLGDTRRDQGDRAGALAAYQESLELRRRLSAADPGNSGWARDISLSLSRIGGIWYDRGNRNAALIAYEESLAIRRRLSAGAPSNTELARDFTVSLDRLGDMRRDEGDGAGAAAAFEESLAIRRHLAATDPSNAVWARDVSVSLNRLGDMRADQGNTVAALAAYEESLKITRGLSAAATGNAQWARDVSVTLNKLGDARRNQGDQAGALAAYEEGLEIARRLSATDPGNAVWAMDLSLSLNKLGQGLQTRGDWGGALAAYEESLAIAQRLATADRDDASWARTVSVSLTSLGDLRRGQGDLVGALAAYSEGLEVMRARASADPANTGWTRDVSVMLGRLGDVRRDQGNTADALSVYEESLEIVHRLSAADPGNALWERDVVVSHAKLAQVGADPALHWCAARDVVARLEAEKRLAPVDAWMIDETRNRCDAAKAAE